MSCRSSSGTRNRKDQIFFLAISTFLLHHREKHTQKFARTSYLLKRNFGHSFFPPFYNFIYKLHLKQYLQKNVNAKGK